MNKLASGRVILVGVLGAGLALLFLLSSLVHENERRTRRLRASVVHREQRIQILTTRLAQLASPENLARLAEHYFPAYIPASRLPHVSWKAIPFRTGKDT